MISFICATNEQLNSTFNRIHKISPKTVSPEKSSFADVISLRLPSRIPVSCHHHGEIQATIWSCQHYLTEQLSWGFCLLVFIFTECVRPFKDIPLFPSLPRPRPSRLVSQSTIRCNVLTKLSQPPNGTLELETSRNIMCRDRAEDHYIAKKWKEKNRALFHHVQVGPRSSESAAEKKNEIT